MEAKAAKKVRKKFEKKQVKAARNCLAKALRKRCGLPVDPKEDPEGIHVWCGGRVT